MKKEYNCSGDHWSPSGKTKSDVFVALSRRKNYYGKNNKKTNESKTGIRSGLNGYTVISHYYDGTVISSDMIPNASSIGYYYSAHVTSIGATYCCGVVAICNILKYYRWIGFTDIPSTFSTLYTDVWNLCAPIYNGHISDGTAVAATEDIVEYYGYNCSVDPFLFPFYFYYIDAISDDHPCLVSYGAEFENGSDGHGIIAVGYTQTTVDRYLTVADGWNPFLRYITFDGYDYDYFRGFEVTVTS